MHPTDLPAQNRGGAIDLLVHGGDVLTVDAAGTVMTDGAVAVRAGRVVEVGPADRLRAAYEAAEEIDARGCLVLPGLINTHTHLAMNLMRGIADNVTLQGFLARVIPREAEILSPGRWRSRFGPQSRSPCAAGCPRRSTSTGSTRRPRPWRAGRAGGS
ncbi:5'-deoxyadenosine deaminase [Streptomyces alboniger]